MGGSLSSQVNNYLRERNIPFVINFLPEIGVKPGDVGVYDGSGFRPYGTADRSRAYSVFHPLVHEDVLSMSMPISYGEKADALLVGDVAVGEFIPLARDAVPRLGGARSQRAFHFGTSAALLFCGFNGIVRTITNNSDVFRPSANLRYFSQQNPDAVVVLSCICFRPALMIVKTSWSRGDIVLHYEKKDATDHGRMWASCDDSITSYEVARDNNFAVLLRLLPLETMLSSQLERVSLLRGIPELPKLDLQDKDSGFRAHRARLDDRLVALHLRERPGVRLDGNCQFAAAADQLGGDIEAPRLRHAVVTWLRANAEWSTPTEVRVSAPLLLVLTDSCVPRRKMRR
jgi:hypothetical protein